MGTNGREIEPREPENDFVIEFGPVKLTRRELVALGIGVVLGTIIDAWDRLRGQPSSQEISQDEKIRGKILAFYDTQGQKIDPSKGFPGNIFYYLVAEQIAPGFEIQQVESTIGAFPNYQPDDRDHPGHPGWPVTGYQTQPLYVSGNQRIYGFMVNMDNVNGNPANKILPGATFKLSDNVTVIKIQNGETIKTYEKPGELTYMRQT